jgi:hypothetical protein
MAEITGPLTITPGKHQRPITAADVLDFIDMFAGQENTGDEVRDFVQTAARFLAQQRSTEEWRNEPTLAMFVEWHEEPRMTVVATASGFRLGDVTPAQWPDSKHIQPIPLPAGTVVKDRPMRFPVRVLTEDEYQLLLAGFKAAGGAIEGTDA